MDIRCLKYFVSVAKHMNFTKAAQECFISQTAMSQHISRMEEELGFKLFYRNNRRVELTPGGKVFLEEATNLLRKFDYAVFWGSVASMDYTGHLRIGFLSYTEKRFLPQLLKIFHSRNPRVEIVLVRKNLVDLYQSLRDGELDVIVCHPCEVKDIPQLVIKKYAAHNLCLVVSNEHPLASEEIVDVQAFSNERFLVLNEEFYPQMRLHLETLCLELGFKPNMIDIPQDMDSLLLMVEVGLGVTLLPPNAKHSQNENLRFIDINSDVEINISHAIAYLSENPNPSLQVFLKIFEEFEKEGKLNI